MCVCVYVRVCVCMCVCVSENKSENSTVKTVQIHSQQSDLLICLFAAPQQICSVIRSTAGVYAPLPSLLTHPPPWLHNPHPTLGAVSSLSLLKNADVPLSSNGRGLILCNSYQPFPVVHQNICQKQAS